MDFLKGKIRPIYFRYLAAAFGSAMITSVYSIVDTAMVGQYHGPRRHGGSCRGGPGTGPQRHSHSDPARSAPGGSLAGHAHHGDPDRRLRRNSHAELHERPAHGGIKVPPPGNGRGS